MKIRGGEENKKKKNNELNKNNKMGIDLGVNNLVSCLSTVGPSFIVSGKSLKAYNQYYNKQRARIQSELQVKNGKKWSNKMNRITRNRENYIHNFFDQTVSTIMKHCNKHNIGTIVMGYNEGWKNGTNIGKVNNQKFTNIPHYLFKQKLRYKCEENGIELIEHEESYTSKCSFLDNELVKKHNKYMGYRKHRGLFITANEQKVNADMNGAGNILRKVFPKQKCDGIEAGIVQPVMLNIFNLQS